MKAIVDTNIVLDVLANRLPFADESEKVLALAASGGLEAAITANTVTDLAYLLRKHLGGEDLRQVLRGLFELVDIVEVNYSDCVDALDIPMQDYEDALLAHCAKGWNADCIVTRNTKDFKNSPVPAVPPAEFLAQFE